MEAGVLRWTIYEVMYECHGLTFITHTSSIRYRQNTNINSLHARSRARSLSNLRFSRKLRSVLAATICAHIIVSRDLEEETLCPYARPTYQPDLHL